MCFVFLFFLFCQSNRFACKRYIIVCLDFFLKSIHWIIERDNFDVVNHLFESDLVFLNWFDRKFAFSDWFAFDQLICCILFWYNEHYAVFCSEQIDHRDQNVDFFVCQSFIYSVSTIRWIDFVDEIDRKHDHSTTFSLNCFIQFSCLSFDLLICDICNVFIYYFCSNKRCCRICFNVCARFFRCLRSFCDQNFCCFNCLFRIRFCLCLCFADFRWKNLWCFR
jgi:hypothetical protein